MGIKNDRKKKKSNLIKVLKSLLKISKQRLDL